MRTLKWLVSIGIALILVIGLGMPFVIGVWIQKVYPKVFLKPQDVGGIQMSLIDYHRGLFSSTAKVAVTFSKADANNRIVFKQIIQHGPLVFERGPHLALALATSTSDDPKFNATARTLWKLNKRIVSSIKIPTLDVASAPIHISLKNLDMKIDYHSVRETLSAKTLIDSLEIQSNLPSPFTVMLKQISSIQDLNRVHHIWYGSRSGTVADLNISSAQGPIAEIHNLSAHGQILEDADKTNIQLNYQTKNGLILNNAIDSADFAFSINGLDSKALANLMEKLEAKKADANPNNTRAVSDSALELIGKGVLIKLDRLSLVTKQGEAKAQGQVSLPPLGAGNIFQLIGALKIDFALQIPQETLVLALSTYYQNDKTLPANTSPGDFAQQQVRQWIQDKILIPGSNGLLMMKVQFENAKLLLNGVEQQATPTTPPTAAPSGAATKTE